MHAMQHPVFDPDYTLCAVTYSGGAAGTAGFALVAQATGGGLAVTEWTALGLLAAVIVGVGAFLRGYLPSRDAAFSEALREQRDAFDRMLASQREDFGKMLGEQRADVKELSKEFSEELRRNHSTVVNLMSGSRPPQPLQQ